VLIMGFTAATNANVLVGSIFEFVKRPSRIHVAVASDVTINAGNLFTLTIGDQVITTASVVPPKTVNTATSFISGLDWPDDYHIQNEPALAGDRVVLSITRAAGNIMWAVQMIEVA